MLRSAVFLLCFATSVACLALLARSYRRTRSRLLLWSALGFVGFALNNLLVFLDLVLLPEIDLLPLRFLASLAGLGVLLFGFVWETMEDRAP